LADFFIPKNKSFNIHTIFRIIRPFRNLQQIEKKQMEIKASRFTEYMNNNNKGNYEIVGLNIDNNASGDILKKLLEESNTKIIVEEMNINGQKYNCDIILGNNAQNQQKVNFADIVGGSSDDYKINLYKIEEVSKGCNFYVKVDNYIDENDKDISLYFEDYKTEKNIINGNCVLSRNNLNKIHCNLDREVNDSYIIRNYLYYDSNELIAIIMKNKTSPFSIICLQDNSDYDSDSEIINHNGLNSGKTKKTLIIIVIIATVFVLAIIITVIIIVYKFSRKKPAKMSGVYSMAKNSNTINNILNSEQTIDKKNY
jgi:hypothetical protein